MHWHDWSEEAFERARERGSLVLLFLRASWCRWCRELEERVLADAQVAERLASFVCVRVDKDRRPDIDTRYRRGGWPTLAVLDAEGEPLQTFNHIEVEDLCRLLDRHIGGEQASEPEAEPAAEKRVAPFPEPYGTSAARRPATLSLELVEDVTATLRATSDPVHGGWGTRHKFPHPEALHFMLERWSQTGDAQTLAVVTRTLRRMQEGEIFDRLEGGFYRYATQPDWSVPHHEKMLDSNAKRLQAYVEAYQALGEESFRDTAQGIARWMITTLLDESTGAFKSSQDADPTYARLSTREARRRRGAPECDPTIFTNYNANAVVALVKAALVLEEDSLRQQALTTMGFLMETMWDEREGMHHYWDGTYNLPSMLTDQATTLRALVEIAHSAGDNRWLERARRLADLTIEHLQAPDGGFYDTRFDPRARGGLRRRDTSILDNATLAEAFVRLGHMTRDEGLIDKGREVLSAFLGDYKRYGHHVASYARVVGLIIEPPVRIRIVGPRDADRTRALRLAALKPYVANRIVLTLDPEVDRALYERTHLPLPSSQEGARAYVDRGQSSYAETSRPERLAALMARTERSN